MLVTEKQIWFSALHEVSRGGRFIENRMVPTRGWRGGRVESSLMVWGFGFIR